jgi:starvation-inducible DNA-binding protein
MIPKTASASLVDAFSVLLADTFALALKTHYYHWNVAGEWFYSLHDLFEVQYTALYGAADTLAERIRALGAYAPGGLSEFSKLSSLDDPKKKVSSAEMLDDLIHGHETVIVSAKRVIQLSQSEEDLVSADMATDRIQAHQKMLWMLRSSRG